MKRGKFSKLCQNRYSSSGERLMTTLRVMWNVPIDAGGRSRLSSCAQYTSSAVTPSTFAVANASAPLFLLDGAATANVATSMTSPATRDHIAAAGFAPWPKIIAPLTISRIPYNLISVELSPRPPTTRDTSRGASTSSTPSERLNHARPRARRAASSGVGGRERCAAESRDTASRVETRYIAGTSLTAMESPCEAIAKVRARAQGTDHLARRLIPASRWFFVRLWGQSNESRDHRLKNSVLGAGRLIALTPKSSSSPARGRWSRCPRARRTL